jgi:hypothetical protein
MEHIRLILAGVFLVVMFFRVLRHFKRTKVMDALTEEWLCEPSRIIMEYVDEAAPSPFADNVLKEIKEIAQTLETLNKQFAKHDNATSVDVTENLLTLAENVVARAMKNDEHKTYKADTLALAETLTATLSQVYNLDKEDTAIGETDTTRILKIMQNLSEEINKTQTYYNAMHVSFEEQ